MNLFDVLSAAIEKSWAFIAAVIAYGISIERRLSNARSDIDMLKAQRQEDQHRIDKVLDDIRDEIRGLRNDIKALLAGR